MPLEKQSQYFTLQYRIVAKANAITLTQTESSALEESGGFDPSPSTSPWLGHCLEHA